MSGRGLLITSVLICTGLLLVVFSGLGTGEKSAQLMPEFGTWNGLGPDKWASIWLVHRHIDSNKRVRLLRPGMEPEGVTLFDTPGSSFHRTTHTTTFEQLREAYGLDSEKHMYLSRVLHDIEVNMWLPDQEVLSGVVEQGFRRLQENYGRDRVPYECYMQFFDNVEVMLSAEEKRNFGLNIDNLIPNTGCGYEALKHLSNEKKLVPEMPIVELFDLLRAGSKVSYIDVREPEEFEESHIPGAENIQVRNIDEELLLHLNKFDLVVAYCVKDFRAFEMAKKLRQLGIENAVILNPYGLKGWLISGLPVVSRAGLSEREALTELNNCVDRHDSCKAAL